MNNLVLLFKNGRYFYRDEAKEYQSISARDLRDTLLRLGAVDDEEVRQIKKRVKWLGWLHVKRGQTSEEKSLTSQG